MKKAADAVKGGKLRKASQVATRMAEGATIVGATDFLASNPGRASFFVNPEDTKGVTGRKKAGAELRNRIKYGAEGTLIGGGFPLVGKFDDKCKYCLLYTSPSPRDGLLSRMPSSA